MHIAVIYLQYASKSSPSQFPKRWPKGNEYLKNGQRRFRMTSPSIGTGGFCSYPRDLQRKWRVFDAMTADQPSSSVLLPVNTFQECSIECDDRMLFAQLNNVSSM